MRAKADEVETANVAIVVLAVHLPDVTVSIRPHQHVQLLPYRIHGFLTLFRSLSLYISKTLSVRVSEWDYLGFPFGKMLQLLVDYDCAWRFSICPCSFMYLLEKNNGTGITSLCQVWYFPSVDRLGWIGSV